MLKILENIFGAIKENYQIYGSSNYRMDEDDLYLLAIHNSGDTKNISKKLWNEESLLKEEQIYVDLFQKSLLKFPKCTDPIVCRYEINTPIELIEEMLKDKVPGDLIINKSFWNFSANKDWHSTEFQWKVKLKKDSNCRKAFEFYSDKSKYEMETIFPIQTIFRIEEIEVNKITMIEQ